MRSIFHNYVEPGMKYDISYYSIEDQKMYKNQFYSNILLTAVSLYEYKIRPNYLF